MCGGVVQEVHRVLGRRVRGVSIIYIYIYTYDVRIPRGTFPTPLVSKRGIRHMSVSRRGPLCLVKRFPERKK